MKKNLFLLLFLVVTGTAVLAQSTITLTFMGRDQNNAHVRLDNVTIQNLTRGWTEAIFFPDTVYTLTIGTGISDYADGNEMQVMPNPFDGRTQLNLCLAQGESVRMVIVDITGKKCAEYNGRLSEGDNIFEIMLTTPQTYILSVQTSEGMHSVKMVNTGRAGANQISLVGGESNTTKVKISSTKSHVFELGDEMCYTGYSQQSNGVISSSSITQYQNNSETIVLHFAIETGPSYGQPCPGTATVTDIDNNTYNTVQIGNQCWMKENLRTTHYANGTSIPLGTNASTTTAYRYNPNDDANNVPTCGYLYNWPAVMHGSSSSTTNPSGVQGICPTGWHVPSDAEWTQLTNYVSSQTQYQCNNSSENIAKALASTTGWYSSTTACAVGNNPSTNNATGFSALPAGDYYGGNYSYFGGYAYFWSATESNGSYACCRYLGCLSANVSSGNGSKGNGFSVRCVRDSLSGGETTETIPTVITNSVSNITATNATCGGNVTSDGGATVTARGVCWSTSQNPTVNDSHTSNGSGTGIFTSSITGLTAGTTYYVRAYAMNSVGTAYGDQVNFTATSSPMEQDGQPCPGAATVTDVDGNVYNTVQIGNQCWMKENLRTTHYANGTSIPLVGTSTSTTTPYRYNPGNDANNVSTYGYLYNWPAVVKGTTGSDDKPSCLKGICPEGWHVPSVAEWTELTDYVRSQPYYHCGGDSNAIAKALVSSTGWHNSSGACNVGSDTNSNNRTGFSAMPAGRGGPNTYTMGYSSFFWSATCTLGYSSSNYSYHLYLSYSSAEIAEIMSRQGAQNEGYSVRCLRDAVSVPTVITDDFSFISSNYAVGGGNVLYSGGADVTDRGICWNTMPNPTINDNVISDFGLDFVASYDFLPGQGETLSGSYVNNADYQTDVHGRGSNTSISMGRGSFTSIFTNLLPGTTYYVRAYATNSAGTAYGNELSFTTLNTSIDGQPCPGAAIVTDYDGNSYNTVQIGNQCWMKENLRTTHYSNGTSIALGSSTSTTTAYRYYPDNSSSNVSTYGYLYNWKAVMRNSSSSSSNPSGVRGICPTGWHVPSDAEWTQLTNYVSSQTQCQCNNSSSYIAKALASTTGWNSSTETCTVGNNPSTNNATGFSALPAGGYGNYYNVFGGIANFWSATEYNGLDDFAYFRYLYYIDASVYRDFSVKGYGFSVRCVRDSLSGGETTETIPTVITNSVSNITATNATCGGNVTSDGGATVTARGVCWSTSQNPTVNDSHTSNGSGTGSFTSNITGLTAGTTYYVRAYATNSAGTAYGQEVSFTTTSSSGADGQPCPGTATVTDYDNNTYNTVQLGNQCWMKENLRTTHYANGTSIPLGTNASTTTAYRYNPNDDANNVPTCGYLYNWPAVMHGSSSSTTNPSGVQGICPTGWHVPSDAEWTQLTNYVGSQTQYQCNNSSDNIAKALASTTGWNSSTETCAVGNNPSTNNATGFSALPAGGYLYGYYGVFGIYADFWSATEGNDYDAYGRNLNYYGADVYRGSGSKYYGFSVRCVRD